METNGKKNLDGKDRTNMGELQDSLDLLLISMGEEWHNQRRPIENRKIAMGKNREINGKNIRLPLEKVRKTMGNHDILWEKKVGKPMGKHKFAMENVRKPMGNHKFAMGKDAENSGKP